PVMTVKAASPSDSGTLRINVAAIAKPRMISLLVKTPQGRRSVGTPLATRSGATTEIKGIQLTGRPRGQGPAWQSPCQPGHVACHIVAVRSATDPRSRRIACVIRPPVQRVMLKEQPHRYAP